MAVSASEKLLVEIGDRSRIRVSAKAIANRFPVHTLDPQLGLPSSASALSARSLPPVGNPFSRSRNATMSSFVSGDNESTFIGGIVSRTFRNSRLRLPSSQFARNPLPFSAGARSVPASSGP